MSNPWKYTDATNAVAGRTLDDGSSESRLVAAIDLEAGELILPPEPQTPPVISVNSYQIRAALAAVGLRSSVEGIVAAGPQSLKDAWEFWPTFSSNYPLILQLGTSLGKTQAEMVSLFQLAETMTP